MRVNEVVVFSWGVFGQGFRRDANWHPLLGSFFVDTSQQEQPRGNGYLIGSPLPCRLSTSRQRAGPLNTVRGRKYRVAQQERHTLK